MAEISHMTALASLRRTFVLSVSDIWPGLVLACVIGVAATFVADTYGGPVMLLALLLGLALHPLSQGWVTLRQNLRCFSIPSAVLRLMPLQRLAI